MALTVQAMVASVAIAVAGGVSAFVWFKPARQFEPLPLTPQRAIRARLKLHRLDLFAFLLAAGGVLSLIPETLQAFAPELMFGGTLAGGALEHLDYVAFVFVSLSFGLGVARRMLLIALEKASLQPCP